MNSSVISNTNVNSKYNIQDALKLLAIIVMIFDHVSMVFYPQFDYLRLPGRIALPIFCFFAGYNSTEHVRYQILFWGVAIALGFYVCFNTIFINLLVGIFFGKILLLWLKKYRSFGYIYIAWIILSLVLFIPSSNYFEASTLPILFMLTGWLKKNKQSSNIFLAVTLILFYFCVVQIWPTFQFGWKIITIISEFVLTFLLLNLNFTNSFIIDCRILSRNLLTIYVGHLLLIFLTFIVLYRL